MHRRKTRAACHHLFESFLEASFAFVMTICGYCYLKPRSQKLESIQAGASVTVRERHHLQSAKLSSMVYPQPHVLMPPRRDVLLVTPWLAPIIWDKTFNIDILNEQFRLQNATMD